MPNKTLLFISKPYYMQYIFDGLKSNKVTLEHKGILKYYTHKKK